uniref:RNA-directed DNA polymerase, eukaryota n=1 Tax=Tanacetum cinerariifolium TaxID=118510 RepID=A0A6L2LXK8_TANCI|nr:RNA-directed DNA polymerase, eukaryota [Tanacetum cinerariifolium]
MGFRHLNSLQSKDDLTARISKSVFVSNFPEGCTFKDLWKVCNDYGTVVDVFIPTKNSKAGKRFAFVRFIKVSNLDRLIENLNTIWIGCFHLFANPVHFERPSKPSLSKHNYASVFEGQPHPGHNVKVGIGSSPAAEKGAWNSPVFSSPALVLDDSCVVQRNFKNYAMGEVKEFSSIGNLRVLLAEEGFMNVKNLLFGSRLCDAQPDFVSRDRLVWVDIEGVPLHAWSRVTFEKICSKWGELVNLEESSDGMFARKRICVKTNLEENILEKFKIIVRRKIFVVRAKEHFVWSPVFKDVKETMYFSEDESEKGDDMNMKNGEANYRQDNFDAESDIDGVSETAFRIQKEDLEFCQTNSVNDKEQHGNEAEFSSDPFNIYSLLNKNKKDVNMSGSDTSLSHPSGFTLEKDNPISNDQEVKMPNEPSPHCHSEGLNSRVMQDASPVVENVIPVGNSKEFGLNKGGLILEVLEGLVKYGHAFHFCLCSSISSGEMILVAREYMVLGDFNEVRFERERMGLVFNSQGAHEFNNFILNSGLVDIHLEGYSYTWVYPSASKMSKLDHFLVSEGLISFFPSMSAICLDKHFSDHRPILLRDMIADYGPTPFRLYHSWFGWEGFDQLVSKVWKSTILNDRNGMVRFVKKLQILKREIRSWAATTKLNRLTKSNEIKSKLRSIGIALDQGGMSDKVLLSRIELLKQLHEEKTSEAQDQIQKAKVQRAIEGDEYSKYFHGVINHKRANLSIKGVMVDGYWVDDPSRVKAEFLNHFSSRFQDQGLSNSRINFIVPTHIKPDQATELEKPLSPVEIRNAVWACGADKSPGPDGFSFDFFRKFWSLIGPDLCVAVEWFFSHCAFTRGCNSTFISFIPKVPDPKFASDYQPISLIGSLYKVVTKILALRLSLVISNLISDVQTAFLPNRQILDGPFILNEVLSWCKVKRFQTMVFKIKGSLSNGMASILVNGSPTSEFQFFRGLKQGDPLAPYLFILVMESFHLSISRAIEAGIFKGINFDQSLTLSHLFYADDAVFIGEWTNEKLRNIMHMLHYFSLSSGMVINLKKSQLIGIGVPCDTVSNAASFLGYSVSKPPCTIKARLSKWKLKTLSIGGRLTLLKSVLGSTPIYSMSLYKVSKSVLNVMESLRRNFFNGVNVDDRKIACVQWNKVLASKKHGGLGVSSFSALNRALLFKWVWRFISQENSLWFCFISTLHGNNILEPSPLHSSIWSSIIKEVNVLKLKGVDLLAHCKLRVGSETRAKFWSDTWIEDSNLGTLFPRLRAVRGGVESHQFEQLQGLIETIILSPAEDRWMWDLNGEGIFKVKDARQFMDDYFLPKSPVATRWEEEDVSHLFFLRDVAIDVSRLIFCWWNVTWSPIGYYLDWLSWFNLIRLGSNVKGLLEGIFCVAWLEVNLDLLGIVDFNTRI